MTYLWGEVVRGPDDSGCLVLGLPVQDGGYPEVTYFDTSVGAPHVTPTRRFQEYVGGLDVSVHYASTVYVLQTTCQLVEPI